MRAIVPVKERQVFEPVKNEKLYEMVVKQVKSLIEDGRLSPGDRLPPERELARMLAVSRASVRQAISAMEALGILESRHGEGTFVANDEDEVDVVGSFSELLVKQQLTPTEILEARIMVEVPAVRMCAERATPEQILAIESRLEKNRLAEGNRITLAEMNRDFHLSVTEGACNRGLTRIVEVLYTMMELNLWPTLKNLAQEKHQTTQKHLAQHEEIFRSVRDHCPDVAAQLMRDHLSTIEQEFLSDLQGAQ